MTPYNIILGWFQHSPTRIGPSDRPIHRIRAGYQGKGKYLFVRNLIIDVTCGSHGSCELHTDL